MSVSYFICAIDENTYQLQNVEKSQIILFCNFQFFSSIYEGEHLEVLLRVYVELFIRSLFAF